VLEGPVSFGDRYRRMVDSCGYLGAGLTVSRLVRNTRWEWSLLVGVERAYVVAGLPLWLHRSVVTVLHTPTPPPAIPIEVERITGCRPTCLESSGCSRDGRPLGPLMGAKGG